MKRNHIYDFAAIGVGPFNLGLACLTAPIEGLNGIFLEKNASFNWHPGMLLQDTTLQIPFIADLVTLADPTSQFSFLNYLKEQGRVYSFYIRENFLMLRNEYNQYCQWAVKKLSNINFNTYVQQLLFDDNLQCYRIKTLCTRTGRYKTYWAKKLILGTGTVPYIPSCCTDLMGKAIHSAFYLNHKRKVQTRKSITIIGSGQSAAEIFYNLLQDIDTYGYQLNWITRSSRFPPLEYSKLTLEMTSPDYIDYFYGLPPEQKERLLKHQQYLYKGINGRLINDIYDMLYAKRLTNDVKVSLRTNSELKHATYDEVSESFELDIYQHELDKGYRHFTDSLILATGYSYRTPHFIEGIRSRIKWDEKERYAVHRNYSIDKKGNEIFVQNAELHTHGFVTPDLGMGCYRNSFIIKEITGTEYYPIERNIAFQQFGCTEAEEIKKYETELTAKG